MNTSFGFGNPNKESNKAQEQMRLDMSGLGITTLDRRAELSSQRDWVAKSNRYEKGLVDKAYRDSNDPWKIRTYAPSIKKN